MNINPSLRSWRKRRDHFLDMGLTTRGTERIYHRLPPRKASEAGISRQMRRYRYWREENLKAGLRADGKNRAEKNWRRTREQTRKWAQFRESMGIKVKDMRGTHDRNHYE